MNARQGKIARLSAQLRDELNQRLLDGEPGSKILPWLNKNPEVLRRCEEEKRRVKRHRDVRPHEARLTDANLSNWRKGGYADWLNRRERLARTKDLAQWSVKLAGASAGKLTEGAAAILSGRILEVLEMLDKLTEAPPIEDISQPAGDKPDPEQLKVVAATIDSLTNALASLRTGDQNNRRLGHEEEKLALIRSKLEQAERALELEQKKFQRLTLKNFIDWSKNAAAIQIAGSGATNSEKIAQLGPLMFGELWKADEEEKV